MKCIAAVLLCFTVAVIATDLPDCPADYKDKYGCVQWKAEGDCETSSMYYNFASENCKEACGFCQVPPTPTSSPQTLKDCTKPDTSTNGCVQWKANGYCDPSSPYYTFVSKNCPGACGICKALPPTPPPPPQIVNVDLTACLGAHNAKRGLHNTPVLSWNSTMATEAAQYALELATANTFEHSKGDYGENLYKSSTTGSQASSCKAAVESWYNEIKDYDYSNPGTSLGGQIGHFTQVIWKSTTKVAVGMATATHNGYLVTVVVARYTPAGNYQGQYETNVLPLA